MMRGRRTRQRVPAQPFATHLSQSRGRGTRVRGSARPAPGMNFHLFVQPPACGVVAHGVLPSVMPGGARPPRRVTVRPARRLTVLNLHGMATSRLPTRALSDAELLRSWYWLTETCAGSRRSGCKPNWRGVWCYGAHPFRKCTPERS
jgi:hypothetical protein